MRVQLQLDVSAEAFFNLLTTSVCNDIKQSTQKNISASHLHGFQYEKRIRTKLGVDSKVQVKIQECKIPTIYQAEVMTKQGSNTFHYELSPLTDSSCRVSYEESFAGAKKYDQWNFWLFSRFFKKSGQKRLINMLRLMEAQILQEQGATV